MRTIGTLIMLGTAGIALYGYTMLFGIGAAFIGLLVLPLATLAYPFVYASYSGVFPWLYVALLIIGGLMVSREEQSQ